MNSDLKNKAVELLAADTQKRLAKGEKNAVEELKAMLRASLEPAVSYPSYAGSGYATNPWPSWPRWYYTSLSTSSDPAISGMFSTTTTGDYTLTYTNSL